MILSVSRVLTCIWVTIDLGWPVLQQGDVLKVDIGVHVKGRICDSAFTLNFEPTYDTLLEAVKAATDTGVRVCRIGTRPYNQQSHISNRKLVLTSGWVSLRVTFKKPWNHMKLRWTEKFIRVSPPPITEILTADVRVVKPIENLSGHTINKYQIHGGKSVLLVKNDDQTKMEEGEYFAIETFGSTGRGRIVESVSKCKV